MRAAGYTDVERGERGSTEEHLTVTQFKVQAEQERLADLTQQAQQKAAEAKALDREIEKRTQKKIDIESIEKIEAKPVVLSKKQKATNIYFTEADTMIEVCTYNTSLKNRLTDYAGNYPSECRLIDNDGNGCLTFEVNKGRFGFKLTAPYSEERRKAASELAKKNTERLRRQEQ